MQSSLINVNDPIFICFSYKKNLLIKVKSNNSNDSENQTDYNRKKN